jgi:hypothetical protein
MFLQDSEQYALSGTNGPLNSLVNIQRSVPEGHQAAWSASRRSRLSRDVLFSVFVSSQWFEMK